MVVLRGGGLLLMSEITAVPPGATTCFPLARNVKIGVVTFQCYVVSSKCEMALCVESVKDRSSLPSHFECQRAGRGHARQAEHAF